jgi:hypothetical protein
MKHVKSRASQGVDYLQNTRPAMMGGSVARLRQTVNLAPVFTALQRSAPQKRTNKAGQRQRGPGNGWGVTNALPRRRSGP